MTFIGGKEQGLRGGRQPGKEVLTGLAVELSEPKGAGRYRMTVLDDVTPGPFVSGNVEPGTGVISDGSVSRNGLVGLGYAHDRRNQKAPPAARNVLLRIGLANRPTCNSSFHSAQLHTPDRRNALLYISPPSTITAVTRSRRGPARSCSAAMATSSSTLMW